MACGLVVVVCLAAAAPALAGEREAGAPGALRLGGAAGWVAGWLAWLIEALAPAPGGPRAVTAEDGSCILPDGKPGPCPSSENPEGSEVQGDTGGCIGPDGAPCGS
jgi:hypothetical protein